MTRSIESGPRFGIVLLCASSLFAACTEQAPPAAAPPPAPVAAAPAPPPPAAPAAAPVASATAAVTQAPPPAPAPKPHAQRQGVLGLLLAHVELLGLKPEQKTAVAGIEADLDKAFDSVKPAHKKFDDDLADSAAAGKLDRAKIDADVRGLTAAVTSTQGAVQDAMNRLHKTLDPEQHKKLIETMRTHAKEMHEHGFNEHGPDHEHGHDHDHGHEHAGPGAPGGLGEYTGAPAAPPSPGPGAPPAAPGAQATAPGAPPPAARSAHAGPGGPGPHAHGPGEEHAHGPGEAGPHPGGPGAGMEHPMLAMLGDELGLTPEQREKLRGKLDVQMKADQAAMKSRMPAMEKHMAAVGAAFESDSFDAKKLGVGSQAAEMVKAMANGRAKFVEVVLSVLTAEQRPKFAAHLREHAAKAAEG